jgi:glyoxylase-like metal-dependent hydrolase (beta-lactamase superfamily II)
MEQPAGQSARLLRVGTTRIDGGSVFGAIPKERWETFLPPDRQNRVAVGNYCMLLPHQGEWILVDAGPGDKPPLDPDVPPIRGRSSLLRDLRELGISTREISVVILTHLRSEHAGGLTHCTASGRVLPTFPNARHVIQRAAWDEASNPNERHCQHYRADDFLALEDHCQLELVDGCAEVTEGVWVEPAPGPTAGHQIVVANASGYTLVFLGVLAPTLMHLSPGVASADDWSPDETIRSKNEVIKRALNEQWWMAPAGYDRWLAADELLSLSLWRRAMGQAPEDQLVPLPMPELIHATMAV